MLQMGVRMLGVGGGELTQQSFLSPPKDSISPGRAMSSLSMDLAVGCLCMSWGQYRNAYPQSSHLADTSWATSAQTLPPASPSQSLNPALSDCQQEGQLPQPLPKNETFLSLEWCPFWQMEQWEEESDTKPANEMMRIINPGRHGMTDDSITWITYPSPRLSISLIFTLNKYYTSWHCYLNISKFRHIGATHQILTEQMGRRVPLAFSQQ